MSEEQCGNCRFWKLLEHKKKEPHFEDQEGSCKRYPPVINAVAVKQLKRDILKGTPEGPTVASVMSSDASEVFCFPVIAAGDWCGEWQAKPTS